MGLKKIRICITPTDISTILNISYSGALEHHKRLKIVHNKKKHQKVTFEEFASYYDIPLKKIYELVFSKKVKK